MPKVWCCAFFLRERLRLELREGLRDLRELRVDDEADVLDRGRDAVQLLDGGAVREGVQRVRRELLLDSRARVERLHEAVRGQLAGPVVRGRDHVRGVRRSDGAEVVADVAEVLGDDLDRRAVRGGPVSGDLGDGCGAIRVGPDHDGGQPCARDRRALRRPRRSRRATPRSAHMRLSEFCIRALPCLGMTTRASWGQAPGRECRPIAESAMAVIRIRPLRS